MSPFRPRGSGAPARTRSTRWGGRALCRVLLVGGALLAAAPAVAVDAAGATTTATAGVPIASPAGGYVALGDSFTAGPGVASQLGPGTSPRAPAACLRSSQNYPSLVARALGLALSDMSCSGATTQDLSGSQGPGIPAQLSALGPATSVVSLGIGGNDLGFSTIVANCAAATPWGLTRVGWSCRSHYTAGGSDQLVATVHRVGLEVAGALAAIRSRAPHARVFVVGYPDIVPPTGVGCWPLLPFSTPDLAYLRGIEDDLNATLADEATDAGDAFVDMAAPSASHDACTAMDSRWVEPIIPSAGGYPLHPTAVGMAGMARVLEAAITS